MRRILVPAVLAGCLLVVLPGTAFAHASFDVRQLPADGTQDLVLRVPLEREAANALVEVLVPGDVTVTACPAAPGWSCEQETTTAGDTVLTLTRGPDGAGDAERFSLSVTAPSVEGVYAFPTIQTYDDGVEAAWIGEPGSDQPAPRIQVGDETAPVEFSGDATPHTDRASDEPTEAPAASPATGDDGDPAPPEPDEQATSTDQANATPTPSGDEAGEPPPTGDGPSPVLVVVGVLLALGAIAGAIARYRAVTS